MEEKWNSRTELLIGKEAVEKLSKAKIIVYGIGGVGSFVVEGLVRAGIEHLIIVDNDIVSITNLNRQIHATIPNIGRKKVDCMKERILSINPQAEVILYMPNKLENEEEEKLIDSSITYVVDAVDSVSTKLKLIERAKKQNVQIISCMGTGNKLDPTKFEISDIYKTTVCPLAKVMRKELRKRNINSLKVVYSKEEPIKIDMQKQGKNNPASISFVPSVAGMIIAGEVIKDIIKNNKFA